MGTPGLVSAQREKLFYSMGISLLSFDFCGALSSMIHNTPVGSLPSPFPSKVYPVIRWTFEVERSFLSMPHEILPQAYLSLAGEAIEVDRETSAGISIVNTKLQG